LRKEEKGRWGMSARVLVVEDDRFIREVVATALGVEGYSVDVAEDGEQAWNYLSRHSPQLVVLDLALPSMDGLTVCRKLRAREALTHTPVLVVSALTGRSTVRAALEAGADAFLDKPFDLADLIAKVQALIAAGQAVVSEQARTSTTASR
jgi:two-component system response regulator RpaA